MKINKLKERLSKDRPMTSITIRMSHGATSSGHTQRSLINRSGPSWSAFMARRTSSSLDNLLFPNHIRRVFIRYFGGKGSDVLIGHPQPKGS